MHTLLNVRLSFPHIFEASPESQAPGAKLAYSAVFLIEKDSEQAKALKQAMAQVAQEKWGAKGQEILAQLFSQDRTCLHDGDRKDYEGYADNFYLNTKSKTRPLVLDRNRSPLTEQDGKPYAGCYVNAKVSLWVQDNQYGRRINCELKGVQFVKDGDSFAAGVAVKADDFEDLSTNDDPFDSVFN